MSSNRVRLVAPFVAIAILCACGKKEEAPQAINLAGFKFDCTIAPSQSRVFSARASSAGGAAAATAAVAKALGLAAVPHSSGAMILTGSAGYISGTLGSAFILPAVIYVGAGATTTGVAIELICFKQNHPDSALRLKASLNELLARAADASNSTYRLAAPLSGKLLQVTTQNGEDAIQYARRKSIEVEEAIRAAVR